jgi:hypothetical protein
MAAYGMSSLIKLFEAGQRLGVQIPAREKSRLGSVFFKNRKGFLPVFPVAVVKRQAKYPGKKKRYHMNFLFK